MVVVVVVGTSVSEQAAHKVSVYAVSDMQNCLHTAGGGASCSAVAVMPCSC